MFNGCNDLVELPVARVTVQLLPFTWEWEKNWSSSFFPEVFVIVSSENIGRLGSGETGRPASVLFEYLGFDT